MSRTTRRFSALVVAAAALSLVVSGCGSAGPTAATAKPKAIGQNDINPKDPSQLKQGGELKWPIEDYPANFNMLEADATNGDIPPVVESVMPTPAWEKADGSWQPDPYYVRSFKLTSTSPEVVTYELNPKATWSDGTPITWADYQSQVQAASAKNPAFKVLDSTGYANVAKVTRGASDYEFTVTYDRVYSDWSRLFAVLYPKSMTSSPAEFNTGWRDGLKITGGPFKVGNLDMTGKTVTVVPDPKWWGDKPKLDRIVFVDTASIQSTPDALANGSLDFAGVASNLDVFARVSKMTDKVTLRRANLPNCVVVAFNGGAQSAVKDPELRKAIIRGIDVQTVTKALVGQITPNAKPLGNHVFVTGFPGYQDNSAGYDYDVDAANKKLDELGWRTQGQFRAKDGKPLGVRFTIPTNTQSSSDIGRLLQNQLAKIGVKLTIDTVDSDSFFDKYVIPGNFDMTVFSDIGTGSAVADANTNFSTGGAASQNFGQIGSPEVNALLKQAAQELDPAKQNQILNQVDQKLWDLGHSIAMYQRPSIVAVRNGLANMGDAGLASIDYAKIGWER